VIFGNGVDDVCVYRVRHFGDGQQKYVIGLRFGVLAAAVFVGRHGTVGGSRLPVVIGGPQPFVCLFVFQTVITVMVK